MIYIFSLIICISFVWRYDFLNRTAYRKQCYYILLVWFILVSGLEYYVGSDTELYINKYKNFKDSLSFDTFVESSEDRRQPGWVLLTWICKQFTDDFLLMKMIQATFFNIAVFSFFRRESKYVFLCIFFYAFSDYLVTNFNVLRHSYAIAFGLFSVTYLREGKYLKYGIFVLLAYMFHNSALLLLTLPLVKVVKPNKVSLGVGIVFIIFIIYSLTQIDLESIALNVFDSAMMDDNMTNVGMDYLKDDRLGAQGRATFSRHTQIVIIVIVYYLIKKRDFFWGGFGIFYLFFVLLSSMMPILWRFRLFFDFPYFILLAQLVVETPKNGIKEIKYCFYVCALLVYMYYPLNDYFLRTPHQNLRSIDQYYPYHSIFDPVKEKRE